MSNGRKGSHNEVFVQLFIYCLVGWILGSWGGPCTAKCCPPENIFLISSYSSHLSLILADQDVPHRQWPVYFFDNKRL